MLEPLKDYAEKRFSLLKLEATEKSSLSFGMLIFFSLLLFFVIGFSLFLFLGLGLLIGSLLGNYSYGILIIAGVFLLFSILVLIFRKSIKNFFANLFLNLID